MRETRAHEPYRPERDQRADDRFRPGETRSWDEVRRPVLRDLEPTTEDFRSAVLEGLSRPRKTLPYRFLYDDRGSALFDRITELEEYYPTRTEIALLKAHGHGLAFGLHRLAFAECDGALALVDADPALGDPAQWQLREFVPAPGYRAALAWKPA